MSTNIRITKICDYCESEFIAKTTVTRYCSHKCNSRDYKKKIREGKKEKASIETIAKLNKPLEELKAKDFLSVVEVSILTGISRRTVYRLIKNGRIKATKLGRRTIVSRSKLNELFES